MRRTISKKTAKLIKFPSPLGVIYFQIDLKYIIVPEEQFPSPLGVIYFQMILLVIYTHLTAQFPSPLGVIFFQIDYSDYDSEKCNNGFPSPLGVIFFQINLKNVKTEQRISFRLLSELSFSKCNRRLYTECKRQVSVSSRSYLFPN